MLLRQFRSTPRLAFSVNTSFVPRFYSTSTYKCSSCSSTLKNKWFCPDCKLLQKPSSNYFELLEWYVQYTTLPHKRIEITRYN